MICPAPSEMDMRAAIESRDWAKLKTSHSFSWLPWKGDHSSLSVRRHSWSVHDWSELNLKWVLKVVTRSSSAPLCVKKR